MHIYCPTRFYRPTLYIFTVLSTFLKDTFLQVTLKSENCVVVVFNK